MSTSVNCGWGRYTPCRHLVTSLSTAATPSPCWDARASTVCSFRALPLVSATISRSWRPSARSCRCTLRLSVSKFSRLLLSSSRAASFFSFIW